MHYVTRWKMHAAQMWLQEEPAPLGELASRLGYESEAAFRRAFKRLLGVSQARFDTATCARHHSLIQPRSRDQP